MKIQPLSGVTYVYNRISNLPDTYKLKDNVLSYRENNIIGYFINPNLFISNADEGMFDDQLTTDENGAVSGVINISFSCLTRFTIKAGERPTNKSIEKALHGLYIMDAHGTSSIAGDENNKPGAGYVWINRRKEWHRSPTVLLTVLGMKKLQKHKILMGVDDDQYFGCELPPDETITSIDEAYTALIPKHIRHVDPSRLKRQGEWFFVQLDGKPEQYVGCTKHQINTLDVDLQYVLRSRNDSPESNTHVVICYQQFYYTVNDTFGINGGKPIPIFGRASVMHNQHPPLDIPINSWWWPIENTALRSFSEQGVD